MSEFQRERDVAVAAARAGGRIVMELFEQADPRSQAKGSLYNLVTEADLRSEACILSAIRETFPDHAILSEEKGASHGASDYLWAVDPLDGTNNYAHKFPFFAVSVALWRGETPLVGVVYDPVRDELFEARRGQGALLNGKPMAVSLTDTFPESIFATGFYYDRGDLMRQTLRQIEAFFLKPIRGIRRTGAAAIDLCYVAAGRLDGFWELTLAPWDYAAGGLIVTEAGGKMTDVHGNPFRLEMRNVLASNGRMHERMLEVTREGFGMTGGT